MKNAGLKMLICCGFFVVFAITLKLMHWPGASLLIVLTAFLALPGLLMTIFGKSKPNNQDILDDI